MSKPLTIVAKIQAKAGCEDQVEANLRSLVAPTMAEAGCINYDLHRSHEKPGLFLFYENWETKEQWETHMESAHLVAYQKAAEDLVDDFELFQMEPVD